ncbi:hypothetical protein E4T38_09568 [Aureobasidium subglaciale]|nr:hypothetical protein E4T38_09568 [Aureobasidium subglaciale]KAI5213726.1 hypothetical protein E4T40_09510 [Aureobasidium subglaciale]KAI5215560.1 hypothetical protein E4T41_09538 [Aureobasidium subglaciale]KAI5253533.1 hypothetical protein E4T46_09502 [Aureobasidium subglaciale]
MAAPLSEDEIRQITLNGANLVPRQIEHKDILHQEVARTAACNLLSNLIEKCSQSSESEFSLLLWQSKLFWRHAFSIYLDQHHALNVKPSRLLLTSLTSVLAKCQDKALCESEKAQMLELLVQHIVAPSENAPTRPAMLVLAHWLSKNMVHVEQLCNSFGRFSSLHDHATMAIKDVLAIVLTLAPYEEFAPAAGSLAALILQKAQSTDQNASLLVFGTQNTSLWSATVLDILKQKPRSLDNFRHFVFPEIFQYDRPSFIAFLDQLDIRSILGSSQNTPVSLPLPAAQCEETLFCALSVGNKLGLVKVADVGRDADNIELFIEKQVLYIPDVLLGDLLLRTSDAVRIAGLAMLTNTTTTTQPLSSGTMDALKKGLPFLHADADAGFRSELFSLIKHLMERIKSATANLAKPQSKAKANGSGHTSAQSQSKSGVGLDTVTAHRSFVECLLLRAIVKSCPLTSTDEALLSPEQLRQLGDLTFTQLAELRHRGAFSTVAQTWAVRNSGLMLFRALMDRLVGTNEAYTDEVTHTQSRLSDDAITSLMKAVLQLLGPADVDVNQVKAEVVFPALQLLQRVQPPSNLAEEIQQSVLRLTSNRQWHVRDKAAKTYAVLVPAQNRASRIGELVRREARTQNEAHGLLLTARYLIGRHGKRFTTQDMDTLVQILQSRIDDLLYGSACPFTQAAFVDVQASFFYAAIQKQRYLFADLTARVDTFSLLATRDPDACTSALRETARLGATNHVYAAQTTELLVAVAAKLLHDDDVDIEVQDAAQEVLVSFFSQGAADDVKKTFLVNLRTSYLPSNAATPLFGDKRLILQGALLNLRAEDESLRNEPLARDFGAWVVQVHGALRVINPFDTRYAAVVATRQFSEEALAYLSSSDLDDSFLAFCLAVYDLCNDDDVEIRTFSAPVATKILNARSAKKHLDMVPLAANQGIAEFIAAAFGSSERAALSAISRATGNAVNGSFPDSIKQSLAEKNGAGPSLFAQEKQNLFIDETREAKLWSSIAARLQPTAFSFRLLMNLCTWVIDGLDVLIAETEARPDQPLGWSRKAEVFTLGMQILYAAELVLKLIKSGVEMPVDSRAVMKRLETLLSRGQENKINVLWLQTLREMLEQRA